MHTLANVFTVSNSNHPDSNSARGNTKSDASPHLKPYTGAFCSTHIYSHHPHSNSARRNTSTNTHSNTFANTCSHTACISSANTIT